MKTIYLAARYGRRVELQGYRAQLEAAGYTVTSRWLHGTHEVPDNGVDPLPHAAGARYAQEDREDVAAADLLMLFTDPPRSQTSRGGKFVELGIALGWNLAWVTFWKTTGDDYSVEPKQIILIGPEENIFCSLPECTAFPDFPTCFAFLTRTDAWLLRPGEEGEGLEHVAPMLTAGNPEED